MTFFYTFSYRSFSLKNFDLVEKMVYFLVSASFTSRDLHKVGFERATLQYTFLTLLNFRPDMAYFCHFVNDKVQLLALIDFK